jgi:hypothetical protein
MIFEGREEAELLPARGWAMGRFYNALRNVAGSAGVAFDRENLRAREATEWELKPMANSVDPLART